MHYVGVDSVEVAKDRVRHRVQQGGHGIPESDIKKRLDLSLTTVLQPRRQLSTTKKLTLFYMIKCKEYSELK